MDIFWTLRGFFRAHWRSYCVAGCLLMGVAVLSLLPPLLIGQVVDGIVAGTLDGTALRLHALGIVGCAFGIYGCRYFWRRTLYGASYLLSLELRRDIYRHLLQLSPAALARFPAGDLMARATNDVQAVEMTAGEAVLSIFDVSKSPEFKKLVIETLGKSGEMSSRKGGGGLGEVDRRIILDERNEAVIERLRAMLAAPTVPGSVAIFYGAAHMGDFDATLRSEFGLERGDVRWFRAMYADEWSRKKIEARIKKLEGEIAALPAAETATDAAAEATTGAPGSGK